MTQMKVLLLIGRVHPFVAFQIVIELSIYEGVSFFGMTLFLVRMAEDTRRFFKCPNS